MPVALAHTPGGLMRWRSNAVVRRHSEVLERKARSCLVHASQGTEWRIG